MNRHLEPLTEKFVVRNEELWTELYKDGKAVMDVGMVATLIGAVIKSPYVTGAGLLCVVSGGIGKLNCYYHLNR